MFPRATIIGQATRGKIFVQNLSHYIPMRVMEFLHDHILPGKGLEKARVNKKAAHKVAHQLLESKTEALLMGKGSRDVMSILGESRIRNPPTSCPVTNIR